ncbi:hypothetical protein RHMOL_Rhmol02G0205200 [Rhododendron molle]|uniref:Uncharacterized protein n=1 Tax=Rhododendron molle TaxID=49168 RepID=A0ACC0PRZ2_RHOML|nr:hypothetical protein RHMOL_Rhmol02G0205200 [Rhododendron molle]
MWGSCPQVYEWYERLPQGAKDAVALAGFELLILGFHLPKVELGLTTALVEWWWDTTNTFHLPEAGEMTITPGDFALLTGGYFGRGIYISTAASFPFYLLGQTLFCNKENSVHVQFLAALVNLETIVEFDWGTPALATLYGHLSTCSRGVSLLLGGHHHVLEVRFDPWDTLLDDAPLELTSARVLDNQHFLLEGPFSRGWYLRERVPAMDFFSGGRLLGLPVGLADLAYYYYYSAPLVWPWAPSFISFHNANGEEERLTLTPCVTQLYMLPTRVQHLEAEWAPTVPPTQIGGAAEGESARAGDGDGGAGADDVGEGWRIHIPVPERFRPSSSWHASKRGCGQ